MPSRLKSLELQGYKTFASRTTFEFAGTVTAIVGPNGSGKSNIADSLRWVLGEQSYSLLRGKKTEDMIFSGSEHRSRAGMASATVVFDNADGWLPIDFSEVAIARRAYRDGQNEYLINAQRVRLKDVSELLAQSGLAERTYTIIGQGLVDAALALKAEERRRLFEEAAGIGLHRSRREEALRRLETTRRNLERVQDIMAELQPRLRSLERQARRAQEYEQVRADLRVLLREWYGYHWHRAQKELTEARGIARTQESRLNQARQEQASLDQKLAASRDHIQGLRARLNSWHRQMAQVHSQREALSKERAVTDERIRSFQEQGQSLAAELARLQEELGLHQERLESALEERQRLGAELEEARAQAVLARQALEARQTERAQVESALLAAQEALSSLNTRQGQLEARLTERRSRAGRLRDELDSAEKGAEAARSALQAARDRLQAAEETLRQVSAAHQSAAEALQAHQGKIAAQEASRKTALEQRLAQDTELARLRAQLEVLEQAENALTGYASGAQALLKAARQARLSGARGALSSQLQVPAELETAIAAALGEFLDAVILEDSASPEQALNVLEGESARGVLLPLDSLVPPASLSAAGFAGDTGEVLGLASDLVSAPPELRPALDLLLGQTLVVRDRSAARRLLPRWDPGGRLVTLRGEVFHASGPIFAGQEGKPSTLSRPRQRKELQGEMDRAERNAAALEEQLGQLDAGLKSLQEEGGRLEQALRSARQKMDAAETAHSRENLALEKAQRQAAWQVEQRDRLKADIEQGEREASQISEEVARIEGEIGQAREHLREGSNLLAGLPLDEFQSQVTHWDTLAVVAGRALSEGQARLQERQTMQARAERALAEARSRLQELQVGQESLEVEKAAQRNAEAGVGENIEALQALIGPAEAELDAAEAAQEDLQKEDAAARSRLSQAEHHHAQARINLARRQEALDGLRRRIEDDFGLVAFEYADEISGPTPLPLQGMVEQLPRVKQVSPELEESIKRQRAQLRRMGAINPEAQSEYQEVKERFAFMTGQIADLEKAEADVRQVIAELDELMERELRKTFDAVAEEFKSIFTRLFGGGTARLVLTDPEDMTNTGIDIEARLPGRRSQGLSLLSGGERSLTAASLVFALLRVSPTPFCVLDEVDAMLDEANVGRFRDLLRELSANTQFIVVTHNRNTVQVADVIYGVTMGRDSASQVISLKLDEVAKVVEA